MKYVFLLIPIILSCSIYNPELTITISGVEPGLLVITSEDSYFEMNTKDYLDIDILLNKGTIYYATLFPYFYGSFSRYPLGCVIDLNKNFITLSTQLGIITESCNKLNENKVEVVKRNLEEIVKLCLLHENPWRLSSGDILLYLADEITISTIDESRTLIIPELFYLLQFQYENRLFQNWFKSIQSFYDEETENLFRVEIYENGTYSCFEVVN